MASEQRAANDRLREILDIVDDLLPCDRKEGCRRPHCRYCGGHVEKHGYVHAGGCGNVG